MQFLTVEKYPYREEKKNRRIFMKENIEKSNLKLHTVRCLLNEEFKAYKGSKDIILSYWEKADTLDEFRSLVLTDERLMNNQGYAELSKESDNHWYRVRKMFGDKCFKTSSDAGSVKIGTENFTLNISNGYGDGTTRVAVFPKGELFNNDMMNFNGTALHGEFNIYSYDCGTEIEKTLNGDYFVYVYEGLVAFVEWN